MLSYILKCWNTLRQLHGCWRATHRFSDYKPQPVTVESARRWLWQFDEKDRPAVLLLLDQVIYLSEKETEKQLVEHNKKLLARLSSSSIPPKKIIYMQIHDPGSSSPVMLNMLRDRARLEQKGFHFVDSKDVRQLHDLTNKLEEGAIIYVDDFAGTGNQFGEVRNHFAEYIVGNFSEFFLLPSICEEALHALEERGVEAVPGLVHSKADRPLHPHSTILDQATKSRLVELCLHMDKKGGLGYRDLATMVVLYRNAPNTVPVILRGSKKQKHVGIFPRTTDLP